MQKLKNVEEKHLKKDAPQFEIGDTVDVHFTIKEENKSRIQVFNGLVIAKKGASVSKNFTVRRISHGEGVERIFPLNSPLVDKVVVKKRGKVRRAKLYYLRGMTGKKATKVKEKVVHREKK